MPEKTKRRRRTKDEEEELVMEVEKERKVKGTKSERSIEFSVLSDVAGGGSRASASVVTPQYFGLSLMGARASNSAPATTIILPLDTILLHFAFGRGTDPGSKVGCSCARTQCYQNCTKYMWNVWIL